MFDVERPNHIWGIASEWPITVHRQFVPQGTTNEYHYTFLYNYTGIISKNQYKEHYIWIEVVGPTSCNLIDMNNPEIREHIPDIEKDDRFLMWADFKPFSWVTIEFSPEFLIEGNHYYIDGTLYRLEKFTSTQLTLYREPDGIIVNYELSNMIKSDRSYSEELRALPRWVYDGGAKANQSTNHILWNVLNRINKTTESLPIVYKQIPNPECLTIPTVYSYKNKFCYITNINFEDRVLYLHTIPNSETIFIPWKELGELEPRVSYNSETNICDLIPKVVKLCKKKVFLSFRNPHVFIYTNKDGEFESCYKSKNTRICLTLENGDVPLNPLSVKRGYEITTLIPPLTSFYIREQKMVYDELLRLKLQHEGITDEEIWNILEEY